MNRRTFLQRIFGFAALKASGPMAWAYTRAGLEPVRSILPENVAVDPQTFRFLDYLRETETRQLGLGDLTVLKARCLWPTVYELHYAHRRLFVGVDTSSKSEVS